jgi:signal transduction histidine kinase
VSNNHSAMNADRYLTQIISTLSTSANFQTTIQNLALLGTGLADWCGIYMFENDQTIRRLAVAPVPEIEALFPLDLHSSTGPAHVRRTGEPQVLTHVENEVAAGLGVEPVDLILPDGRRPSIYACLPAMARGSTIGAVVFMSADATRSFGEIELSLASSLANAAAVAMDNSRLYRDAQEANRLKDEFVAMVSHELRTPLTPMLGCIHLLRTAKLSQQNFDRALEMIERNAQTQLHIVEDLLDASRIVAGKLHLIMKTTSLAPILEAAMETVRSSADAKDIKIITDFEDVQSPINGDPHRLQQIFWNLLSNAVKFTPSEGRVAVSLQAEHDHCRIQVTDTGIGIPADLLPYIFDRFRQGADGNSATRSGLGLGLAIVRHLVELHNGSIEAASSGPGQGAVFTLRFPFAAKRAAATVGLEA